jgi:hypothetical protein
LKPARPSSGDGLILLVVRRRIKGARDFNIGLLSDLQSNLYLKKGNKADDSEDETLANKRICTVDNRETARSFGRWREIATLLYLSYQKRERKQQAGKPSVVRLEDTEDMVELLGERLCYIEEHGQKDVSWGV